MAVIDAAAGPGADGGAGTGQFRLHVIRVVLRQPAQRLQVQAHGLRQARDIGLCGTALGIEQAFARVFGRRQIGTGAPVSVDVALRQFAEGGQGIGAGGQGAHLRQLGA